MLPKNVYLVDWIGVEVIKDCFDGLSLFMWITFPSLSDLHCSVQKMYCFSELRTSGNDVTNYSET